MSIDYKSLMPVLGEAAARSRASGRVYHVVSRRGLLGRLKTVATDTVREGDTVLIADIGFAGVSASTLDGNHAAFFDPETRGTLLRALRHVLDVPADAPVPAIEASAGLYLLACALSEQTYRMRACS